MARHERRSVIDDVVDDCALRPDRSGSRTGVVEDVVAVVFVLVYNLDVFRCLRQCLIEFGGSWEAYF